MAVISAGGQPGLGIKLLVALVLAGGWVRLLTWIHNDAVTIKLPAGLIDVSMLGGVAAGLFLFFTLPGMILPLLMVGLFMGGEAIIYLALRRQVAGLADVKGRIDGWVAGVRSVGLPGGASGLVLMDQQGAPFERPRRKSSQRTGYDALQAVLSLPLAKEAQRIKLTPVDATAEVRYVVDGVARRGAILKAHEAAMAIALAKRLAGLDGDHSPSPSAGIMRVALGEGVRELKIEITRGMEGESLRIRVDPKAQYGRRLDEMGLTAEQLAGVCDVLSEKGGIVLVAAPKGQGLRSMLYALLRQHNAQIAQMQTIEPNPLVQLDGVIQHCLPLGAIASEAAGLVQTAGQDADVLMASLVESSAMALALVELAQAGKRVYVGIRAAGILDALAAWRRLVKDDQLATSELRLVMAGRLLRRLCPQCKVGYRPDAQTLRKLNMDPSCITELYQAEPSPQMATGWKPCPMCKGHRFHGRIGIFEILQVSEEVRQAVVGGKSVNPIKSAFRKQKGLYLQESALAMVERGETSVQEVLRVLRPTDGKSAKPSDPRRRQ